MLSEDGMAKTLQAVADGYEVARKLNAQEIVAAATMASRIARNTQVFLDRAQASGHPIEVLSGDDEAKYGFEAVANDSLFKSSQRVSIIDVGGHSSELVTAEKTSQGWNVLFRRSFPIGALALREHPLEEDSPQLKERLQAVETVDDCIGLRYLPHQAGEAVTLGATGTNLVGIRDKIPTWDPDRVHGAWLGYEDVSRSVDQLCSLDDVQRSKLVGIEKGREHTVHAGAIILERFLFALGSEGCKVSVRGWRHGLLESLHY